MAKVRQDVVNIVGSGARKIAAAVVEEAKKGQLATTKYLFEMAGVFPTSAEAEPEPDSGEESLAKILVDKLKLAEDAKPAEGESVEESGESEEAKDPVIVV